jgi:hypothetical protein
MSGFSFKFCVPLFYYFAHGFEIRNHKSDSEGIPVNRRHLIMFRFHGEGERTAKISII